MKWDPTGTMDMDHTHLKSESSSIYNKRGNECGHPRQRQTAIRTVRGESHRYLNRASPAIGQFQRYHSLPPPQHCNITRFTFSATTTTTLSRIDKDVATRSTSTGETHIARAKQSPPSNFCTVFEGRCALEQTIQAKLADHEKEDRTIHVQGGHSRGRQGCQ